MSGFWGLGKQSRQAASRSRPHTEGCDRLLSLRLTFVVSNSCWTFLTTTCQSILTLIILAILQNFIIPKDDQQWVSWPLQDALQCILWPSFTIIHSLQNCPPQIPRHPQSSSAQKWLSCIDGGAVSGILSSFYWQLRPKYGPLRSLMGDADNLCR